MHVEADLHEARHDLLNLFLSRAFLHHHYHAATLQGELPCFRQVRGTRHAPGSSRLSQRREALRHTTNSAGHTVSRAEALPHMFTRRLHGAGAAGGATPAQHVGFPRVVLSRRLPFEAAGLVDDPLEQPRERRGAEWPAHRRRARLDVPQHFVLAGRLVDVDAQPLLDAPNLQRAGGALVQQGHELLVEFIDALTELVDLLHRSASRDSACAPAPSPLSHRMYDSTAGTSVGDAPCSATTLTRALPTTAASAQRATSDTCSGREMPKPTTTGSVVSARMRATRASAPEARVCRAPVTPRREMPYRNPLPRAAARRMRSVVVVGLSRKIVSSPASWSRSRTSPASSSGRSSVSTPSTPAAAARVANAGMPMRTTGLT